MRILLFLIIYTLSLTAATAQSLAAWETPAREYRAVWLTTLMGLDWPRSAARTPEAEARQRQELCRILDQYVAAGMNTVLFQARLRSTTAYRSDYEPWDGVFTGTPGRAPGYDPLAFAVEQCHLRGLECHAWVVAYPICNAKTAKALGAKALPAKRPELCQRCGEQWVMDPGVPGTDDYVAAICREIVERYDVDGIHLDYLRYPADVPGFNDAKTYQRYGGGRDKAKWRTENVSRTARKIAEAVRAVRPWVRLSCSPIGKYKDLARYSSYGWNARDKVSQECQRWLAEGWMDALFPMMYFDGKHFYPFVADWKEHSAGRPVCPGLGAYRMSPSDGNWELQPLLRQLRTVRRADLGGYCFFRSKFLTDDVKGLFRFLRDDFNRPARSYASTVLPPAATWLDSIAPSAPAFVRLEVKGHEVRLTWDAVRDNSYTAGTWRGEMPVYYNVYRLDAPAAGVQPYRAPQFTLLSQRQRAASFAYVPALPAHRHARYFVAALDAFGNEGPMCEAK